MLDIQNLHAQIEEKEILKGLNLHVGKGEIHAIMGSNGAGKSTLSNVLTGHPNYEVTEGSAVFNGKDLFDLVPEERAQLGMFMSFQYPVEIPGVSMNTFLRTAVNSIRKARAEEPMSATDFLKLIKEKQAVVELNTELTKRAVNVGFSGGEKKRNEIFQMLMLNPSLAILDETDSGLDIDALRIVAHGVNSMRGENFSALVITHYQRLLDFIKPDFVHVLLDGQIIKSGDASLALELEKRGYDWLKEN